MLELYCASGSLCSQKVKLVLAEKKLPWKGHLLNLLTFENLQPSYMNLNPKGVVPTLIHDGQVINDSAVIIQYLDDQFPHPPLTPAASAQKALMQRWINWQNQLPMREVMYGSYRGLTGLVLRRSVQIKQKLLPQLIEAHPKFQAQYAAKLADVEQWNFTLQDRRAIASLNSKIEPMLTRVEAQLAQTEWLCGGNYSLADVVWTAVLNRLEELAFGHLWAEDARPALRAYLNRLKSRPSFKLAIEQDAMPLPVLLAGLGRTLVGH